jgi:diacylglycerol kinase family enzyme
MVKQAQQFQELARQLADDDTVITVAGDGLLPYIARCMAS